MKTLEFPYLDVQDNLILNKENEVWGLYKLDYSYLKINDEDDYLRYVENTANFLNNRDYKWSFHLIPRPFDFEKHIDKTIDKFIDERAEKKPTKFDDVGRFYLKKSAKVLKDEMSNYEYDVIFSVQLNDSQYEISTDLIDLSKRFAQRVTNDLNRFIFRNSQYKNEFEDAKAEEESFIDTAGYFKSFNRLTEEQIYRYTYYFYHRTEGIPDEITNNYNVTEGIIQQHVGYMTIEHKDHTEYIATLPIIEMPAFISGFKFIDNLKSAFNFPLEINFKYKFKPKSKDEAYVRKYKKRLTNFDKEIQTGEQIDEDDVVSLASERLTDLLDDIKKNHTNLMYFNMNVVVSAQSLETLNKRVKMIQDYYEGTDFKLTQPNVDQLILFHTNLFATTSQYNYFEQIIDPFYLAQSSIDLDKKVGNNYGFPFGKNVTNLRLKDVTECRFKNNGTVFLYPALTKYDLKGANHTNGNMLITGPQGSGKSMGAKYMFTWSAFFGTKILYIDPKNEYERHFKNAVDKFGEDSAIAEVYNNINFTHLSSEERYRGSLDPLIFLKKEEEVALQTAEQIFLSLGSVRNDDRELSNIITSAVKDEMKANKTKPTMTGALKRIKNEDENLGKFIERFNTGLGKVLFGKSDSKPLSFDNQISVLGIQGINLGNDNENSGSQTDAEKLGTSVMTAISKYVYIFSRDVEEDAAIYIDEAWILRSSRQGEELINETLRTGRSLKTDIVLITQAFDDYNTETFKELIGCKMSFKPKSSESIDSLLDFFNITQNQQNKDIIEYLKSGMCLYQDHKGRNEVIAVDILFDDMFTAFKTTDKENTLVKAEEEFYV